MKTSQNIDAAGNQPVEREIKRRTITAFSVFFICLSIGGILFFKLFNQPQSASGVQPTLRKVLNANEKIFSLFFSKKNEARSFKKESAVLF